MATRRRERASSKAVNSSSKRSRKQLDLAWGGADDEHIDSDSEVESIDAKTPSYKDEEDESDEENLDLKKVRLARQYLEKLEEGSDSSAPSSGSDDEKDDDERDAIGRRLQRDRLKREGLWEQPLAGKLEKYVAALHDAVIAYHKRPALTILPAETAMAAWVEAGSISLLRGHDLTPTCVALQASGEKAVSGSKDHSVILWDIERNVRLETIHAHWKRISSNDQQSKHHKDSFRTSGQVLAVACSDDGRYAAVGKRDHSVSIFDIRMHSQKGANHVKTFHGHKSAVTCLAFRTQSNQLFSGSDDRCIRHYNLDEMLYMETLYGHQFGVASIDCHRKERPISVAQDRTARAWKLQEDTHLIFRGGAKTQPADCVSLIKDDWFVTGHQDGALSLWITDKKRAVATILCSHGTENNLGRPIVSVDCLKGSDVVASGSHDGYLRLWKADTGQETKSRGVHALTQIPLHGFINDIAIGPRGRFCVVAVGQEHRLGRWNRVPRAKNRIAVVKLYPDDQAIEEENGIADKR